MISCENTKANKQTKKPKTFDSVDDFATLVGFPGGSGSKESTCNVEDLGLISGLGRSPGGGHGNRLQYFCLDNPQEQRSLEVYSPWGHRVGHD